MPKSPTFPTSRFFPSPQRAGLCVLLLTGFCSLALQGILESGEIASRFVSHGRWSRLVEFFGGQVTRLPLPGGEVLTGDPSLGWIFALNLGVGFACWGLGAWWIARRTGDSFSSALGRWGVGGWLWGTIPALWEIARIAAALGGVGNALTIFLIETAPLWMAFAAAGWMATFCTLMEKPAPLGLPSSASTGRGRRLVILAGLVYVVIFTLMNWGLHRNLLVPHGDSAMYEEHLWNLTHGKGFRSYLEPRLFLGEHLQVVHVLLLPVHVIWPSLMAMDFCESLALASGALPVFWMTRRHARSERIAVMMAVGYLLYFPMQYLDIAIDLKTFRPTAFGIPAILFGLDLLERGRLKSALACWLVALSAQEDFAIVLAPLGVWIALRLPAANRLLAENSTELDETRSSSKHARLLGLGLALFSTVYLILALTYIIPWFRGGDEIHYVGYFQQFGSTLGEVVTNVLSNPRLLFSELFAVSTPIFAASLLIPLGGMAVFSPGRLLVAAPFFGILCLNQIDRTAYHHFHAPLVPILFWAAASGVATFPRLIRRWTTFDSNTSIDTKTARWAGWLVTFSALATGLFAGMSPLGMGFWDPDSRSYWKARYVMNRRAELFPLVMEQIPQTARVFSTDFVHPRFTHHARSYDYSAYPRATDEELRHPVPGETYYLVVDTQHPYSTIKTPAEIPEYRDHPEDWELLPDRTEGYFIVLKRGPSTD